MKIGNWRLGLDLGTNSIGWSVISLDNNNRPSELINLGSRIFSDGRNQKTKEPLAVERRTARSQRKIIYRRKLRRRATFKLLREESLMPNEKEEALKLKALNPYTLRIKSLDEKLEPYELGRVLFNLSVRRGFKSNRKDNSNTETSDKESKSEKVSQKQMQSLLETAINESGCRTLGEFLYKNQASNNGIRFVPGRMIYYPTRKMYEDEFQAIRNVQEKFYPQVRWDAIREALFFQRPLKPQHRGYCVFMPENERTYKAMPCAQKVRILQDIRNLKYYDELKKAHPISDDEDVLLQKLFDSKEKVSFDQIRKTLKLSDKCTFNLEENRDELKGNSTAVKMRSPTRFGTLWDKLSLEQQDDIVEILITAKEDSEVQEELNKYELTVEQKQKIVELVLPSGTTMLCREVTEQLVEKMEDCTAFTYSAAVESLGYKYANQDVEKFDFLPYYGKILVGSTMNVDASFPESNPEKRYGKISNPTVHVALNQVRTVVNALIKEYGKPRQIALELSRDLKASRESKKAMEKKQNENKKRNGIINNNIREVYGIEYPNRNDRLKYRLWEELDSEGLSRCCLYCGKIISGSEIFTKNIEIEHILPYSRTLLDSESNLTVAHASCNAFKREQSPFEAFGNNPKGFNWQEILLRANRLKNPSKINKFSPTAMETFEKDSSFIARQLTDNAYLSKMALKYLRAVCGDIWSVNGGMTKLLRDKWDVDSILSRKFDAETVVALGLTSEQIGEYKKNRKDHRHHAIDAVVIALTDRGLVKEISTLNARKQKNRIEVPPMCIPRLELIEKVKNIVVSFKPDHGVEGKLSKETLLGKIKQEEKIGISTLKEEDISCIKNERVRNEIQAEFEKTKDIKSVRKTYKDIYPQLIVFRSIFVARSNLSAMKEKDLESIVDETIKKRIKDYISEHKNIKPEDAILKFSEETGIKKVRCINRVQAPIEIKGNVSRYLAPEDYFSAIIWELPPKKEGCKCTYNALYLRRDQIDKNGEPKPEFLKKPHPAARKIGTIHKNDYLEFSDNGKFYKCRVAGYSATNQCIDIRPIFAVNDCLDWLYSTNENLIEPCWKSVRGQNFITVNTLFEKKSAKLITVNPIGKVFRKK